MTRPVYFDGFATTPMRPEAKAAIADAFDLFGNPNSGHQEGRMAQLKVDDARIKIAELIGSHTSELVLVSGATEANELACSVMFAQSKRVSEGRKRIVISAIEHEALQRATLLEMYNHFEVVICPISKDGRVNLHALEELVDKHTLFVSIMYASNLTGIVQPISEAAEISHRVGALFHSDAAQAVGKIPIDVFDQNVDALTFSAHKFGGPKGIGAVYFSSSADFDYGPNSSDVQTLRYGTPAVPLIAGFGAAAHRCAIAMDEEASLAQQHLIRLREGLAQIGYKHRQIGEQVSSIPGTAGLIFSDCETDDWIARLNTKVCLSNASACTDGQLKPTLLLNALQIPKEDHAKFLRVSMGWWLDVEDIERALNYIAALHS